MPAEAEGCLTCITVHADAEESPMGESQIAHGSRSDSSTPRAVAIIPARGGSKGIPGKNLQPLAGKPLIAHAIEAAQASARLARYVVSTDDEAIAKAAHARGCPVIMRPAELASDCTPIEPVLEHALACEGGQIDIIVLLQPTTPFRRSFDIDAALDLLLQSRADSVVSVCDVQHNHPSRMYRLGRCGRMVRLLAEPSGRQRQDLEPVYIRNGALYLTWVESFRRSASLLGADCAAYLMPPECSINIDTPLDLEIARFLAAASLGSGIAGR
jgi:N-acylneuraminate cytidylyltransferase